jgi:hypothetical protein
MCKRITDISEGPSVSENTDKKNHVKARGQWLTSVILAT